MNSSAQDELIERIRLILDGDRRIQEKRMFGGLSFLLRGHILIAARKDGGALLSVGKEHNDEAMARPGTTQMVHGGRIMRGFVFVDADALEDDDDLRDWIRTAERWVSVKPAKAGKAGANAPAKKAPGRRAAPSKAPRRASKV